MFRSLLTALFLCAAMAPASSAQNAVEGSPVFYSIDRSAGIYSAPDLTRPIGRLPFREPLFLLEERGDWLHVKTQEGKEGYVPSSAVSNVWILVSRANKTLYVYRGTELYRKYAADFGYNDFADKERRGSSLEPDHWRTPVGAFFVAGKNPRSQYYKALVLNYPTARHAERGLRSRLISEAQYDAIVRAEEEFRMPPMNTLLGGWIEIHGHGTGARINWTQGCVAIQDRQMDEIWSLTHVGTPVYIE